MKIDRPGAIIELDADDLNKFAADEKFREKLFDRAQNLSDRTGRTVCVYIDAETWVPVHGETYYDKFEPEALELIKAHESNALAALRRARGGGE